MMCKVQGRSDLVCLDQIQLILWARSLAQVGRLWIYPWPKYWWVSSILMTAYALYVSLKLGPIILIVYIQA